MTRRRPYRRYLYRRPDTGREFKLWRGEALDRVVTWCLTRLLTAETVYVQTIWRRDVRMRT